MPQTDPDELSEQKALTNSARGLALIAQPSQSFPRQLADKYRVGALTLIKKYGEMLHDITSDLKNPRALLGAQQFVKLGQKVDEDLASNQWVAVRAKFEVRDYGFGRIEVPVGPFEVLDAGTASYVKPGEQPTQRVWYLHGGRPAIPTIGKADERPELLRAFNHLLGLDETLEEALRVRAPTTPEQIRKLNEYIHKLQRQVDEDKSSALPDDPPPEGKEPIEVADVPEEALAELNRDLGEFVDVPPEPSDPVSPVTPPTGDIGVASVPSARALRAAGVEGTPTDAPPVDPESVAGLLQRHLLRRKAILDQLLKLSDAAFARRPPIPPHPGGSPARGGFTLKHETVRKLAGEEAPMTAQGPAAMLSALLGSSSELKGFHKLRKAASDEEAAWVAMLLGGRWRTRTEAVAPGDLVYLATPMLDGGGCWALALKANQRVVTEALVAYPGRTPYHFVQRVLGVTARAWSPSPQPVLSDSAPMGRFWGPNLQRFRAVLERHLFVPSGSDPLPWLIRDLTAGLPFETESFQEFLQAIGPELYLISQETPLYAGCILLTDRDDELGVLLSDGRILGYTHRSSSGSPFRMEPRKFQPQYVWYPHA